MNSFSIQRGPDAEGLWIDGHVGLAHRRLSIIDLSERGRQPMLDRHRHAVITYNGEIYNYRALRAELEREGLGFDTDTDTEVILNGYLAWGLPSIVERLDGMFAFVLYDRRSGVAFLCRDRFGEKPLYYHVANDHVSFSSDIRALWRTEAPLTIDFAAVDYYLSELAVPQPRSIWKEIKQVRPAHYMTIAPREQRVTEARYWNLGFTPKAALTAPEVEAEVARRLTDAVIKRTVGDRPLGAFLSGGVDSGLVVALLASHSAGRVKTFSVGFTYEEYNELPLARSLAERYGTDHTEIVVTADVLQSLPTMIEGFGEPFADSSSLPTYLISRESRSKVTVALSGEGGDEIFGGYYEYPLSFRSEEHLRRYPGRLQRFGARAINRALWSLGWAAENYGLLDHYAALPGGLRLFRQMGFHPAAKHDLYAEACVDSEPTFARSLLEQTWRDHLQDSMTDTLFAASVHTRLLNDYLVKVDRASMMNSLEVRNPYLDRALVEFAASIPNDMKLKGGISKYLLKRLGLTHIDPDLFQRRKWGFGVPLGAWLRKELRPFVWDVLRSQSFVRRGIFRMERVESLLNEHASGVTDHAHRIWALLCLELWFRRFVDRRP